MSNPAEPSSTSATRPARAGCWRSTRRVGGIVIGLFWLISALVVGDPFLHELPLQLVFGWIGFLNRSVSQMEVSWPGIAVGGGLTVALIAGLKGLTHRISPGGWSWQRSCAAVGLMLVLFVSGMAFTGLCRSTIWVTTSRIPWIQHSRTSMRRAQSKNNLKQLALSAMNYHEVHHVLPPGGTFNREGTGQHSWITHLLPYLDEHKRHQRIDLAQPWNAPTNSRIMREPLNVMLNPGLHLSHDEHGFAISHYAGNSHLFGANGSQTYSQITDGQTQTILAGEVRDQFRPWGEPMNCRNPARPLNTSGAFGSPTIGGTHFVFADGSVRFLSDNISPDVLKALATPAGGEKLPPEFDESTRRNR